MNGLTVPRSSYGLGWGAQAEPQAESQGIGQCRQAIRAGVKGAMLSELLPVRRPQSAGDRPGDLGTAGSKLWDHSGAGQVLGSRPLPPPSSGVFPRPDSQL